jgi:hypothetical protein
LHENLKQAADQHGLGISAEIRDRLEKSLKGVAPAIDAEANPRMRELVRAVNFCLTKLQPYEGADPLSDPNFYAMIVDAIITVLEHYKPGEPDPNRARGGVVETFGATMALRYGRGEL